MHGFAYAANALITVVLVALVCHSDGTRSTLAVLSSVKYEFTSQVHNL